MLIIPRGPKILSSLAPTHPPMLQSDLWEVSNILSGTTHSSLSGFLIFSSAGRGVGVEMPVEFGVCCGGLCKYRVQ